MFPMDQSNVRMAVALLYRKAASSHLPAVFTEKRVEYKLTTSFSELAETIKYFRSSNFKCGEMCVELGYKLIKYIMINSTKPLASAAGNVTECTLVS